MALGLHFPDVDHRFGWLIPSRLLLHRSILTHGMLVPLLLYWLIGRRRGASPSLRSFALGASLAIAVHLCFDFFPRGWTGFALIHVPVYGRTTALFSQAWVLLSIVGCLYLSFQSVRYRAELVLGCLSLILSFAVAAAEEGRSVLAALMILASASVGTFVIARRAKTAARRA